MTAGSDAAGMHNTLRLVLVGVLAAACASSAARQRNWEAEPVPPASQGERVIQIHDVRDLVTPAGDPEAIADLAAELREPITFLYGSDDPDASITAKGTSLVVVARPHLQARIRNFLARKRAGVEPNGL